MSSGGLLLKFDQASGGPVISQDDTGKTATVVVGVEKKSMKSLQGKIIRVFMNDNVRVAAIFVTDQRNDRMQCILRPRTGVVPALFCTICEELRDTEGRLSCKAFPCGFPQEMHPCGCGPRRVRDFGFMPKHDFEEMARRWEMFDNKDGVASSILERDIYVKERKDFSSLE